MLSGVGNEPESVRNYTIFILIAQRCTGKLGFEELG